MSTTKARTQQPRRLLDGIPPDTRVIIADASWDIYESLVGSIREGDNCRVAFDGNDIEMMSIGPFHDLLKSRADAFVAVVAGELAIDSEAVGSTTWKRKQVKRGIESDLSYYFKAEQISMCGAAASSQSNEIADYPNPDLAIEIDLSRSRIDRLGIYAALQVPELWRARERISRSRGSCHRLGYVALQSSQFLHVTPAEVTRWIFGEESLLKRIAWEQHLREWVRAELGPRVNA